MNPKKLQERKERLAKLDRALKKLYPNATIELTFKGPWQLLVAVILSAQCTDKQVNKITPALFAKYGTPESVAKAGILNIEKYIRSCGFYHNKAKNIVGAATMVVEKYKGKVPKTIEELLEVPGVARKTATVVLKAGYGITAGITVDTHVIRFVQRYDLSDYKDPVKIEKDLMQIVPKSEWGTIVHRIIHYGRYMAPARAYDTTKDPLVKIYPKAAKKFRV